MAGETPITLVGNLVDAPELRYTQSGAAVANFRVASTPRVFDKQAGQWRDGEAMFLTCTAWRAYAENAAETLTRGTRVIVQGRLKQRSFETKEGQPHIVFEVDVDEVGPALRFATAKVARGQRSGGGPQGGGGYSAQAGGFGGQQGRRSGPPDDGPWASDTPEPPF